MIILLCYLPWRLEANSTRDLYSSAKKDGGKCPFLVLSNLCIIHTASWFWSSLGPMVNSYSVLMTWAVRQRMFNIWHSFCHPALLYSLLISFLFSDVGITLKPCDTLCHLFAHMVLSRKVKESRVPNSFLIQLILSSKKKTNDESQAHEACRYHDSYKEYI